MTPPPVPALLANLPTWRGIVVPYVTLRHDDGTPLLGEVNRPRLAECLHDARCQLCHAPLKTADAAVLMARPMDFGQGYVNEPAQHPWCAAYAVKACPMLSGRLDRNRVRLRSSHCCGDPGCVCAEWAKQEPSIDAQIRAGQPASPWFSVRFPVTAYTLRRSARGPAKGVALPDRSITKIRLVSAGRPDRVDLTRILLFDLPWT
ncbi:hypothetical protein Ppa06_57370 [Planomonospora parontospora subsp. parontospora]|uniref:Uncharacterized protein n=2 Tax=Planomonospora parontospora TaxID=58119 RepID=A0AA37BLU8_9ACTN|nr:hypothetical protein [Planomonospora parontospora]GGK90888.1 hypothetical protein GCM10010126_57930 [Planomonospora parontospora]GII11939.1 hypothetical protein Ppa06_57370 [Planomonospora parontospora subsp. parontospora]